MFGRGMVASIVVVILKTGLAGGFNSAIYKDFLPVFTFIQEQGGSEGWTWQQQINSIFPLHGYYQQHSFGGQMWSETEGETASEWIINNGLETEANTETSVVSEGTDSEDVTQDNAVQANGGAVSNGLESGTASESGQGSLEAMFEEENRRAQESLLEEALIQEQQLYMEERAAANVPVEFVPHTMVQQVDLSRLQNYETLVSEFYTIDANTMAGSDQLDAVKLDSIDVTISKEGDAPQILIYHTHSQEGFADSIPGDESTTIIGVGEYLTQILTEDYGYKVLHHTGKYDVDSRDDAYGTSLPAIEQLLEENPSIQVVIDLHRDQMPETTKLVMDLDGRPTARFMFFNGLSRTRKTGDISYLYNEYQQENLAFSFQMKKKAEEYYPGLTRKNYLKAYRYNMHLCPKTLLIELGAQNNTVEEAMNACEPLAHILDMVLTRQ